MSEITSSTTPEATTKTSPEITLEIGKLSVLEALAKPAEDNLTPSMTWQSAWSGREDK